MRYGKREPEFDERTIQFSKYMDSGFHAPTKYDFDKQRAEIPISDWGSQVYNCDVIASQANQLLRFGRIDERRTLPLHQRDVVNQYKRVAGSRRNHDENDIGVSMLQAFKAWQKGWWIRGKEYKIAMYGEVYPNERGLVRTAIYIFRGVHFGFWLPKAVEGRVDRWDWNGENGELWKPGSLGGTAAYCKAYNPHGYEVIAWGNPVWVTNSFVEKYCDECWIAVESIDYWAKSVLDLRTLLMLYPSLVEKLNTPKGE